MIKTVGLYMMVDNDIDPEWIAEDLIGKVAELVKGYITVTLGEPTPAGMYAGANIKIIVPEDEDEAKGLQKMLDLLDDNDDVQNVWHNWEDAE